MWSIYYHYVPSRPGKVKSGNGARVGKFVGICTFVALFGHDEGAIGAWRVLMKQEDPQSCTWLH